MELKKEFVKNCRKIGVLQEFLCQAIDQIDEKNTKIIQLKALIENYNRISKEIIDNANHQKRKRCLSTAKMLDRNATNTKFMLALETDPARIEKLNKLIKHYYKWSNKWIEIANQFKEI